MLWIIIIAVIGYFVYKNFFEGQEKQKKPVRSNATQESAPPSSAAPKKVEEFEPIREFNVNGVAFRMIRVDGGTFLMGATKKEAEMMEDTIIPNSKHAKPVHNVSLDTYMIGETQVTLELWKAVMGENSVPQHERDEPYNIGRQQQCIDDWLRRISKEPKNPITIVNWNECKEFIHKLNSLTGETFSLPTEAEWEFAARGGIKSQHFIYSGSNNLDDVAWNWHNSGDQYLEGTKNDYDDDKIHSNKPRVHPVGMLKPNELGLFDMSGNGFEWCEDYYGAYFGAFQTNPKGPGSGTERVMRGGSYILDVHHCINSARYWGKQDRGIGCGLRLAIRKENSVREFNVNGVSFRMVCVEGGYFWMGATEEQGSDAKESEKPTRGVKVNDYMIGETQVTQELWEAVMGSNPSMIVNPKSPVENVSWDDCKIFIRILNSLTGQNFRLPSEAEWEYAARGGCKSQHYKYSGSNTLDDVAWNEHNSGDVYLHDTNGKLDENHCKTHPVGTKLPNEIGIYDMSGNVEEWCEDRSYPYSNISQISSTSHIVRGGSFAQQDNTCRVSSRSALGTGQRFPFIGLRLAL